MSPEALYTKTKSAIKSKNAKMNSRMQGAATKAVFLCTRVTYIHDVCSNFCTFSIIILKYSCFLTIVFVFLPFLYFDFFFICFVNFFFQFYHAFSAKFQLSPVRHTKICCIFYILVFYLVVFVLRLRCMLLSQLTKNTYSQITIFQ